MGVFVPRTYLAWIFSEGLCAETHRRYRILAGTIPSERVIVRGFFVPGNWKSASTDHLGGRAGDESSA